MEQSKFYQIKNVTEHEYTLVGCDGSVITRPIQDVDKSASAFTIQDAKDGDVVVDKSDGTIGIFQSIGHHPDGGSCNDPSYCLLHCRYHYGFFYADFEHGNTIESDDLIPATKEQRDTLMKAMADAGYTFDFKKKELKKIEQKPTWSEEDEMFVHGLIRGLSAKRDIHGHTTFSSDCIDITETINWLKHLKDRVLPQPKQEWSEEDEEIYRKCICAMRASACGFPEEEKFVEQVDNWLKSLKDRYTWKPSDEQIEALESATANCAYSEYQDCLRELIGQLKKLK